MLKSSQAIFINGPPRSGKTTIGQIIQKLKPKARTLAFADKLKMATHDAYWGLTIHTELNFKLGNEPDSFEDCKDEPNPLFIGKTPREAYIAMSEKLLKPLHGKDIFGRLMLEQVTALPHDLLVFTDCGFLDEVQVLVDYFGPENCRMLHVHRPGCDFSNDSRGWVLPPEVKITPIDNSKGIAALTEELEDFLGAL